MQNEVAECLLTWHNADHSLATSLPTAVVAVDKDIRAALRRQNIAVAEHAVHISSTTADSVVFELQNLATSTTATTSTTTNSTTSGENTLLQQLEALHAPSLLAVYGALSYLHLWKSSAHRNTLDITFGKLRFSSQLH